MFKILMIITLIMAIFCLYVATVTLFAIFCENELPDIEDVEFS
jgi:hypothetical protein